MRRIRMSIVELDDPLNPSENSAEGPPPRAARAAFATLAAACLAVVLTASVLGATGPAATPAPSPAQYATAPADRCPGDHMRPGASSCLDPCARYEHLSPSEGVACAHARRVETPTPLGFSTGTPEGAW